MKLKLASRLSKNNTCAILTADELYKDFTAKGLNPRVTNGSNNRVREITGANRTYALILRAYFRECKKAILNGNEVVLPNNLGSVQILAVVPNYAVHFNNIDWFNTNKLWAANPELKESKTHVYITNSETNGRTLKFNYTPSKTNYKTRNLQFTSIVLAKAIKREAYKMFRAGKKYIKL